MCGIVGVFGHIDDKVKKVFDYMHLLDSLRGPHSSGIFTVDREFDTDYIKNVGLPPFLLSMDKTLNEAPAFFDHETGLPAGDLIAIVGHNRYATVGQVNIKNAHPFDCDNVIGVHNGTIFRGDLVNFNKFTVDSEALLHNISLNGLDVAYKGLHGAAACVYWDRRDNTLVAFRNKERPLTLGVTKDKRTVFFASDDDFAKGAFLKCGLPVDYVDMKNLPVSTKFTLRIKEDGCVEITQSQLTEFSFFHQTTQQKTAQTFATSVVTSSQKVEDSSSLKPKIGCGTKISRVSEFPVELVCKPFLIFNKETKTYSTWRGEMHYNSINYVPDYNPQSNTERLSGDYYIFVQAPQSPFKERYYPVSEELFQKLTSKPVKIEESDDFVPGELYLDEWFKVRKVGNKFEFTAKGKSDKDFNTYIFTEKERLASSVVKIVEPFDISGYWLTQAPTNAETKERLQIPAKDKLGSQKLPWSFHQGHHSGRAVVVDGEYLYSLALVLESLDDVHCTHCTKPYAIHENNYKHFYFCKSLNNPDKIEYFCPTCAEKCAA